tara:strand:+ start:265 stop:1728 length:1464 start_codon:yes stop_codon:yes gene_type:complete
MILYLIFINEIFNSKAIYNKKVKIYRTLMFKKIEIWILYLVLLFGIPTTIFFGVLVRQETEGITKKGKVDISFLTKPAASIARIPEKLLLKLVMQNDNRLDGILRENRYFYTQNGFNGTPNLNESYLLLSRYDGEFNEGIVELVDLLNFEVIHTWNPDIDAFNKAVKNDEFKNLVRDDNNSRKVLYHPKLTKDGGLLFGWNSPLRKIDACSNLIFQKSDSFHHSIETDIDGNIWIPSRISPISLSIEKVVNFSVAESYMDDSIVKLSPDGEILFEKSLSQIFIDNGLEYLLFARGNYDKDPFHLNDIQPVDFDGEFWQKGDVFLSLRHQSMILLYRPSTNKIIWKGTGPFFNQHDVNILSDYKISIFNNNSKDFGGGKVVDGHNQVIIYDFKTKEYSYYLNDSLIKNDVRTIAQGRSQILPNGDLFVEETNYGRTLYFNSDGSLRWNHVNRSDNGGIYTIGWSRILYDYDDVRLVKNFLKSNLQCND